MKATREREKYTPNNIHIKETERRKGESKWYTHREWGVFLLVLVYSLSRALSVSHLVFHIKSVRESWVFRPSMCIGCSVQCVYVQCTWSSFNVSPCENCSYMKLLNSSSTTIIRSISVWLTLIDTFSYKTLSYSHLQSHWSYIFITDFFL